jgi:hypothetical protein
MRYPVARVRSTSKGRPWAWQVSGTFLEVLERPDDDEYPSEGPARLVWKPPRRGNMAHIGFFAGDNLPLLLLAVVLLALLALAVLRGWGPS